MTPQGPVLVWPVWELQGYGGASPDFSSRQWGGTGEQTLPAWFNVRLTLKDGTCIDILAVVCNEQIAIEDIRCNPPLFLDSFDTIAARVAAPLKDAYQALSGQRLQQPEEEHARWDASDMRREWFENVPARQGIRPRGRLARLITAEAYQRARQEGRDPILAVMCATGRSRRRSLRLIAHARDDGYLSPRHNRR